MTVRLRVAGLVLALGTLLVYLPAGRHGFVVYDDPEYVTENRIVQAGLTGPGLVWAATTWHAYYWHPLTWLSHMLDCELFGLDAGAHHLVSVALHTANAFLLLLLWFRLTGAFWPSVWVAAFFAWHPLRVESVAWAAERKDVLSAFFFLLTLLAWERHVSRKSAESLGRRGLGAWYGLAVGLFALGLMAKPMLVTLPFVLLLLDYWPCGRFGADGRAAVGEATRSGPLGQTSDGGGSAAGARPAERRPMGGMSLVAAVVEKWPFFVLSAGSCVVTFLGQRPEVVVGLAPYPLWLRLGNALLAYAGYLGKMVWPADLAVIYPLPMVIPWEKAMLAAVFLGAVSWCAWRWRRERPYWPVGWCWYVGMLVPVIGVVQVGGQAMADRFTYLPLIGISVAVAFEADRWVTRLRLPVVVPGLVAGVTLAGCLAGTARQLPVWRDSESLFSHALAVTRDNAIAHVNLGVAFEGQGRAEAAMHEYQSALGINPGLAEVHNNLGNLLESAGRTNEALAQFLEAVRLKPGAPLSHDNLATLLVRMGRYDEAMRQYAEAAGLDPRDPRPDYLMGKALLRQGRSREAVRCFRDALRLDANHLRSLVCLARVLASDPDARTRNGPEAVALAQQALAIAGGKVPLLLDTLGMAYAEAGRFEEAEAAARQAIEQAQAGGEAAAVGALRERLKLYESRRPWRASPGDDRE